MNLFSGWTKMFRYQTSEMGSRGFPPWSGFHDQTGLRVCNPTSQEAVKWGWTAASWGEGNIRVCPFRAAASRGWINTLFERFASTTHAFLCVGGRKRLWPVTEKCSSYTWGAAKFRQFRKQEVILLIVRYGQRSRHAEFGLAANAWWVEWDI